MNDTVPAAAEPIQAAGLSAELKAAILAAADHHLAAVTADVTRLKGAVGGDLAGIATAGTSEFERLERSIAAELARLRTDLAAAPHRGLAIGAALAIAAAAAALGHFVAHLF